jgi:glycosyltransferase involved in cell wall biosynthesis
MRVMVWPSGGRNDAVAANRLYWPADALTDHDVTIGTVGPKVAWSRPWAGENPPADVDALAVAAPDADVVVLQRPTRKWWAQIIPMIRAHGVRVVVDVDDDFAAIPHGNRARDVYDPRVADVSNWAHLASACHLADLVTVTTPALASRYGRHGRVRILPNLVPAAYLNVPHADNLTVGWTGTVDVHPDDLETTGGTVQGALDRHGWQFRTVGPGHGVRDRLRLTDEPQATGYVPIVDYPQRYAELGAAIVPLSSRPFNDAKSALKMMEAAALGVPVVGSPTYDNQRLFSLGVGLLAKRPHDWTRQLDRVLGSADLRAELSADGRAAMAGLTYENRAGLWLDAWTRTSRALAA